MVFITVPPELVHQKQWVCWKGDKKIPYDPITGKPASTTDPTTWASFVIASEADGYRGIGFVFAAHDPYTGIDIDNCVEDGILNADAQKTAQLMRSYTEVSQSGNGIHIIVKGKKPGPRCRANNVEIYGEGRYFVMTGQRRSSLNIHERQDELDILYRIMFPPEPPATERPTQLHQSDVVMVSKLLRSSQSHGIDRSNAFMSLWMGNIQGYPSHSEADLAFCGMLATESGDFDQIDRIFRKSGLYRIKWNQKRGQQTYGEATVERALRG